MPSKTIVLSPVITVNRATPLSLSIQTNPCRYYAALNMWKDNDTAVQLYEGKVDSVKSIPLDVFPLKDLPSYPGLYCDVLVFPGSFAKGEKFSFALEFTQNGSPCAASGTTVASGEFADDVVSAGGQIIHLICKFA